MLTALRKLGRNAPKRTEGALYVMTSYPRAGTHWLKKMISDVLGEEPFDRIVSRSRRRLINALDREASHCLVYDHFVYDLHSGILDPAVRPNLRMLLLYRNPLDALISDCHLRALKGILPYGDLPALENARILLRRQWSGDRAISRMMRRDMIFASSFRDYVKRRAVDWLVSGRCFPVRYEDLVADAPRYLKAALEYLGIEHTSADIARSVERNDFMRLSGGRVPGQTDAGSHYRRGVPGEWREVFSEEDIEVALKGIGDYLEILGYTIS